MILKNLKFCVSTFIILIFFSNSSHGLFLKNSNQKGPKLLKRSFSVETIDEDPFMLQDELLSNIEDFINLPEGGTPWEVFGETLMNEYKFVDDKGFDWVGVKPQFSEKIKMLDSQKILVQGYMFPLDQEEKQKTFLLIPFPASCPYYPHVSSNLIIEVHAKLPINYSYDAVDIEGVLELVPNDDLYNIFFRLKDAQLVSR